MRKKILIFPIHAGLAHLFRSIALAEELSKNNDVTIEIHEKKLPLFQISEKVKVLTINDKNYDDVVGLFRIYIKNINVKEMVEHYRQLYVRLKPDLIITDVSPAALIAAVIDKRKHVMVNNSEVLPFSKGFPGWFSEAKTLPQKIIARPVELFLDFWKRYFINIVGRYVKLLGGGSFNVDELIKTTTIILPEVKEYVALKKYLPNIHHVGPMIYDKIEARDIILEKELEKKSKGKKPIYLTFGGTGFGKELLLRLIKMLVDKNYFVIVAAGNILDPSEVKLKAENLYIKKFISGFSACKVADIILSHGSYGTVVQALHWGKPIVCIPFNIDQIYHGLKIKELKVGKSLISLRLHHFLMNIEGQQKMAEEFDPVKIVKTVEEVMSNKQYSINAKAFSKYFQKLDGVKNAVEIIEEILEE